MNRFAIFSDASVSPKLRLGIGAFLALPASVLEKPPQAIRDSVLPGMIKIKKFENTSSTELEVRTVLWALEEYCRQRGGLQPGGQLRLYSDSQCIAGLPGRRAGLEAAHYVSGRAGRPLKNASLYRAFYELQDRLDFAIIKMAGHTRGAGRDTAHSIFAEIDRHVRRSLRLWIKGAE